MFLSWICIQYLPLDAKRHSINRFDIYKIHNNLGNSQECVWTENQRLLLTLFKIASIWPRIFPGKHGKYCILSHFPIFRPAVILIICRGYEARFWKGTIQKSIPPTSAIKWLSVFRETDLKIFNSFFYFKAICNLGWSSDTN